MAEESKPGDRTRRIGIIVGIVALIALIALVVVLVVRGNQGQKAAQAPVASTSPAAPSPSMSPSPSPVEKAADNVSPMSQDQLAAIVKANTPVYFVKDTSILLPGQLKKIQAIADALSHFSNVHMKFRGHTADFNLEVFQQALSVARAERVRWAFENRVGYDLTSVDVVGLGSREPVRRGDTEADRAPNRRVEIIVLSATAK